MPLHAILSPPLHNETVANAPPGPAMPSLEHLPLVQTVLVYYAGATVAFVLFQLAHAVWRRRNGKRLGPGGMCAIAEDGCNLLWFSTIIAVPDILDRIWDRSSWGEVAIVLAMTGALLMMSGWLASRRIAQRQMLAVPNNNAGLGARAPKVVPVNWSNEARIAALLLPALVVYIGGVFACVWAGKLVGLPLWASGAIALSWLTAVPLLVVVLRWPFPASQRHTLVINVPPEHVWDTLHCRATDNYYRGAVARIEQSSAASNRFIWHYVDVAPCPLCGLPRSKHAAHTHSRLHVEVVEQVVGHRARQITTFPPGTPFHGRLLLREENSFEIQRHPDGATVIYQTRATGMRLWVYALTLSGNVPKDLLEDLKAHLEGRQGNGVFASARKHREHADASPMLCGCTN